jgi:endogenous inhibitor of DNA gyrase (YacG/DUF329 family)
MIRGKCPICSKTYEIARLDDLPTFPFCTERCRLVDLGRWIDGKYAIPGAPAEPAPGGGNGDGAAAEQAN